MKMTDINQKTDKELAVALADGRKLVAQLAIDTRTKQVANVKQIHAAKRSVAQLLTATRLRQLATAAQAQSQPAAAVTAETPAKEENHG